MQGNILVAYFSASGETAKLAATIADVMGGRLFQIKPVQPYTPADLDWNDSNSRTSIEMRTPESRPEIAEKITDLERYDTVFLGFPIWWYEVPHIILNFLESYDFSGKTLIPFATSGGSGMGNIDGILKKSVQGTVKWCTGKRMISSASRYMVQSWAEGLPL